jgi:alpha-soluble NSF attachment protein
MDNQLLRYSAKDYFFRASVCRMCQEVGDAATSLAKYEEMFPAFTDSRECKLVKVGRPIYITHSLFLASIVFPSS